MDYESKSVVNIMKHVWVIFDEEKKTVLGVAESVEAANIYMEKKKYPLKGIVYTSKPLIEEPSKEEMLWRKRHNDIFVWMLDKENQDVVDRHGVAACPFISNFKWVKDTSDNDEYVYTFTWKASGEPVMMWTRLNPNHTIRIASDYVYITHELLDERLCQK